MNQRDNIDPLASSDEESTSIFEKKGQKILDYLERDVTNPKNEVTWYQRDAVLQTKKRFERDAEENRTGWLSQVALIVAPTGAGKSGIIVLLPYALKAKKALILTPSKINTEQLAMNFGCRQSNKSFFEISGMIPDQIRRLKFEAKTQVVETANHILRNDLDEFDLVIVNAQKVGGKSETTFNILYLNNKEKEIIKDVRNFFRPFDLLIVDEAHHYPAPTWDRIVKEFLEPFEGRQKKVVFLTATPYRDANERFILGEGKQAKERVTFDITDEAVRKGKAIRECKFLEKNNPETLFDDINCILEDQRRFLPECQAMVIVYKKDQARKIVETLNRKSGRDNFAIAITTDSNSVDDDQTKFTKGNYKVAVVCGKLLEGYDNSNVSLCVIRRNVQSQILFNQFIGYCMRMKRCANGNEDKTTAIVLSYKEHNQRKLWDQRDMLAQDNPVEVDDESAEVTETPKRGRKRKAQPSTSAEAACT